MVFPISKLNAFVVEHKTDFLINVRDGHKETSPIYELLAAGPFNQWKRIFRYSYSKLWVRNFNDLKQNFEIFDNTHFFRAQNDQGMEKP